MSGSSRSVCIFLLLAFASCAARRSIVSVDDAAPEFKLMSFERKVYSLNEMLRNSRGVALCFFSPRDPFSPAIIAEMNRLREKFGHQGLGLYAVIAPSFVIRVETGKKMTRVEEAERQDFLALKWFPAYRKQHAITFEILFDPNAEVTRAYCRELAVDQNLPGLRSGDDGMVGSRRNIDEKRRKLRLSGAREDDAPEYVILLPRFVMIRRDGTVHDKYIPKRMSVFDVDSRTAGASASPTLFPGGMRNDQLIQELLGIEPDMNEEVQWDKPTPSYYPPSEGVEVSPDQIDPELLKPKTGAQKDAVRPDR